MTQENIINQLNFIYYHYEWWHPYYMNVDGISCYHKEGLDAGRIKVFNQDGLILGYYERWNVSHETFDRLKGGHLLKPKDIIPGGISYLYNVWIQSEYRNGYVAKELKRMFLQDSEGCEFLAGQNMTKEHTPVRIFRNKGVKVYG